jgi:serine/threonine protein kinase
MADLVGNYEIIKQIGEGGFGRVFQAKHVHLGERACVKNNILASEDNVNILKNEATLLWKLDEYHSIPAIKDFFLLEKESAIIVMSYIDGKTLEDIVKDKGALHAEDACWITERLLGALYYAHYNGVVHSDVKPENVFVEPKKRDIKLIDFGLASYKPKGTTKPLGYSPKYAAPELMSGNPPIPESDFYGAGLVLLRALGGDLDKKTYRRDTPFEVKEFCDSLLRYDPKERLSWQKGNAIQMLSDIRLKVFGRRHMSENIKGLKGGAS